VQRIASDNGSNEDSFTNGKDRSLLCLERIHQFLHAAKNKMNGVEMNVSAEALETLRQLRIFTATKQGWMHTEKLLDTMFSDQKARATAAKHVKELFASNLIVVRGKRYKALAPGRLDDDTIEKRSKNYHVFVEKMADRFHTDAGIRRRYADTFKAIRRIYGLHRFPGKTPCLLVPTSIMWTEFGPRPATAIAVVIEKHGIRVLQLGSDCFRHEANVLIPSPFLERGVDISSSWLNDLDSTTISPFSKPAGQFPFRLGKVSRQVLKTAYKDLEGFCRWVGVETDYASTRLKSIKTSMNLATPLSGHVRRCLWSLLDVETRRLAMTHPAATFERYKWICGYDDVSSLRRRQALSSYPLFWKQLKGIEKEIDAGDSVDISLSRSTGIPVRNLKRLQKLTWQKAGESYHYLSTMNPLITTILQNGSVDFLPPRQGWNNLRTLVDSFDNTFSPSKYDLRVFDTSLCNACLKNAPSVLLRLPDFFDALNDLYLTAKQLIFGYWDVPFNTHLDEVCRNGIIALAGGSPRSIRFMDKTSRRWHREISALTILKKRWRRIDSGSEVRTWLPLSDGHMHKMGSLSWICDEDDLEIEGILMSHCVGSYTEACVAKKCHIARVEANDGRSTAEFQWDPNEKTLHLVQLKAAYNLQASDGCYEVVHSFLDNSRHGLGLNKKALQPKKREYSTAYSAALSVSTDARQAVLQGYDQIFPGFADLIKHARHAREVA